MSAPLYDKLRAYHRQNRISFAMPGHKNGRGLRGDLLDCDVTELAATENLHSPSEAVAESKRLLAKLYGADESFIVTGGSTTCIQAMIAACIGRGGTLLAAADCHMSVINACAVMGIKLRLIPRETDEEFLIAKRLTDIEEYIDGADAVLVTSPTYYGLCADVEAIVVSCHKRGIPLLVDEAHGAHFAADERFPKSALALCADAVCQSAHKTLGALTGAAYLHVRGNLVNPSKIARALTVFETSSPSYVIAASADIAREELEKGGWEAITDKCESFKKRILTDTKIKILRNDDPTRLVLNFGVYETTGFEIERVLAEKYGTDIEMADLLNIVLIVTPYNTAEDMEKLYRALLEITEGLNKREKPVKIPKIPVIAGTFSPADAFFGKTQSVPIGNSAGRVSAVTVTPYPPGIPVIFQGTEITQEQIEYIERLKNAGAQITGIDGYEIEILKQEENV